MPTPLLYLEELLTANAAPKATVLYFDAMRTFIALKQLIVR